MLIVSTAWSVCLLLTCDKISFPHNELNYRYGFKMTTDKSFVFTKNVLIIQMFGYQSNHSRPDFSCYI